MRPCVVSASVAAQFIWAIAGIASPISWTGTLDPSDPNTVALFEFALPSGGALVAQSWGYGGGVNAAGTLIPAGGFDSYLSLFFGDEPAATFLASNDDGGCPPGVGDPSCRDARLELTGLAPGIYTLTVTTFGNLSFAENYGSGSLGDGFVGLGSYFDWDNLGDRSPAFAVDLQGTVSTIPEPALAVPLAVLLLGIIWRGKARADLCKETSYE